MSEWILRSFPPNDSISLKDFFGWTNRSVFALILMAHIISLCTGECIFQNLNQQQLLTIHRHVATWRIRTGDRGLSTHASSAHSLTGAALVRPHLMTDCIQPWKDDRVMPKYAAPSCSFTLSLSLSLSLSYLGRLVSATAVIKTTHLQCSRPFLTVEYNLKRNWKF